MASTSTAVPGVPVNQQMGVTRDQPLGPPQVSGNIIAMPAAQQDETESVYVFGFPVDDHSVAPLVRNVLRISIAAALLVIISNMARYQVRRAEDFDQENGHDSVASLMVNIMIGLAVPACGYFGAKHRNRGILSCFYGWSMAQACCGSITVFVLLSVVSSGGEVIVQEYATGPDGGQYVVDEHVVQVPMSVAGLALTTAIIQVALSCLQFYFGRQLLESEYFSANYALEALEPNTHVVPAQAADMNAPPGYAVAQPFAGQVPNHNIAVASPIQAPGTASVPYTAQPAAVATPPPYVAEPTAASAGLERK